MPILVFIPVQIIMGHPIGGQVPYRTNLNNSLIFHFVKTLKISAHFDNFYSRKKSFLNELKFCKGFYLNEQKSFIPKENCNWLWFIYTWYLNLKKCFYWINWTNIVKHGGWLNRQEKMHPKLIQFIFTSS